MANLLIAIFGVYVAVKIILEIREVFFIKKSFAEGPVFMDLEAYKDSAIYAIYKHTLNIFEALISLFIVVFWVSGGFFIVNFLFYKENSLISELEILFIFFAVNYLFSLPLSVWSKHIDKRFGFNVSSWKMFIIDELKKIVLFLIFGGLFFAGLIYFIENFENWWILGFVFTFGVVILINLFYPLIASMFNKFEPLKDEELKTSIEEMMKRVGFRASGIFVMDASKRDTRLNAYFAGLGNTKKVVLFDTLLNKLNKDEILAVLGHELGHFKHKDIFKNIALIGVMLFVVFFIFGNLPDSLFKALQIPKSGANIIMLAILFSEVVFFVMQPIINYVSRKNEFAADEMGSELVNKKALASALKKLVSENRHYPRVSELYSIIHYTHPPIIERIKRLEDESINNRN